ncbi:MAG: LD-carboxypeptidase [Candidatus Gottesmanbacteria bacterium]
MTLLKPPKLQRGDTIGIVATSFPLPRNEFPDSSYIQEYKIAIQELENMGFKVKEGKNLNRVKWWFAGTAQERATDINEMFTDPEVKAIMVHEGGQSAIAVLELIDYELVKKHPKPFIGFSDVTNIHIALHAQTGLVGFHGPLLTYSLGKIWEKYLPDKKEEGKSRLLNMLTSDKPAGVISPFTEWQCWKEGEAEGTLFGGNLGNLASLVGTKYFPKLDDIQNSILFWEIDNVPSYRIEKGLYQLKYAGILDCISGMLVGKLPDIKRTAWEGLQEPTLKEIVLETLKDYSFPIIGEVDFGHKTVDTPMPIGIRAKMIAKELRLEFLEAAVQ